MIRKHVITGGACVGKTTLIEELDKLGYNHLPEAARNVIQREQKLEKYLPAYEGIFPWTDLYHFQEEVRDAQISSENMIEPSLLMGDPNGWEEKDHDIFLDRSLVDGIAYGRVGGIEEIPELREMIKQAEYSKIFFLEHLDVYFKDEQRYEDEDESRQVHEEIYNVYTELGFDVVRVPAVSIEERVDIVLNEIKKGA